MKFRFIILFFISFFTYSALFAQLSGTYTIGGTSPNFATVDSAIQVLQDSGISGSVTFNIRQGTYSDLLEIDSIAGSSNVNTITFQADSANTADVIITHATTAADPYVLKMDGTDYITFKKIHFNASGISTASVIFITGHNRNIEIDSCKINAADVNHAIHFQSPGDSLNVANFTLKNSEIIGGTVFVQSIFSGWNLATLADSFLIANNVFVQASISCNGCQNGEINHNYFYKGLGVFLNGPEFFTVNSNIFDSLSSNAISSNFGNAVNIINNEINTLSASAVNLVNTNNAKIYFNSIQTTSTTNTNALNLQTSSVELKNNIVVAKNQARCFGLNLNIPQSHNAYYAEVDTFGFVDILAFSDFSNFKSYVNDTASLYVNPRFFNAHPLIPRVPELDSAGIFIPTVTTDIRDSIRRNPNPSIGAYEYTYVCEGLAGVYTIDPNGVGNRNFASINSAVEVLMSDGVCDSVIFNIKEGTYSALPVLNPIYNSGAESPVYFQSDPSNSAEVIIHDTLSVSLPHIIQTSAHYVTFKGLTISAYSNIGSSMVKLEATPFSFADHITFDSCKLYSEGAAGIGGTGDGHEVKNCEIVSNGNAVSFSASGNIKVHHNVLNGGYGHGLTTGEIYDNTIYAPTGIYVNGYDNQPCKIYNNTIISDGSVNQGRGIFAMGHADSLQIFNNSISFTATADQGHDFDGIYLFNPNGYLISNNTIYIKNPISNNRNGIFLHYLSSTIPAQLNPNQFRNNNISIEGNGYALFADTAIANLFISDFNNYYTTSDSLFQIGQNGYETLADFKSIGSDSNSVSVNPGFIYNSLLISSNDSLQGAGITISGITEDIRGFTRENPPTIGAYECIINLINTYDTACFFAVYKGDTLTQSGLYSDTLTNIYGCDSILNYYLHIIAPASPIIVTDTLYCSDAPVSVNAQVDTTLTSTLAYVLWFADSASSTIVGDTIGTGFQFFLPNTVGTYTYFAQLIDSGCASAFDTVSITVNQAAITATHQGNSIEACINSLFTLSIDSVPGYTYQWYKNANSISNATAAIYTQIFIDTLTDEGQYYAEISGICGVKYSDTIQVNYADKNLSIGDVVTCYNEIDKGFDIATGSNGTIKKIIRQADAKYILIGDFTEYNTIAVPSIIRIFENGQLDVDFVTNVGNVSNINDVEVDQNQNIYIAGNFTSYNGQNRIARLLPSGAFDNSFNSGSGFNGVVNVIALDASNKIIAGGDFTQFNGNARNRITRLNTNGTNDVSFNVPAGGFNFPVFDIEVMNSGSLIVSGSFTSYGGVGRNRIAKILTNGALDLTFTPGTGPNLQITKAEMLPDNRILIAGDFTNVSGSSRNRIAVLDSNGTLNTGFNPVGVSSGNIHNLYVQADGKVIIVGTLMLYNGEVERSILRINPNGTKDNSLNFGLGFLNYSSTGTGASADVHTLVQNPDGSIVCGGKFDMFKLYNFSNLVKVDTINLLPDTNFLASSGANNFVSEIFQLADGRMALAGAFGRFNGSAQNKISLLKSDGTPDFSFVSLNGFNNKTHAIAQQNGGSLIIGGEYTRYASENRFRLSRINLNGQIDLSFAASIDNGLVSDIAVDANGKVFVAGSFTTVNSNTRNRIVRLNANGSLDNSFLVGIGFNQQTNSIVIDKDSALIAVGNFTTYKTINANYIARILPNGDLDTSFSGTGFNNTVSGIRKSFNHSFVVFGNFSIYQSFTANKIVRLLANGNIDSNFVSALNPDTVYDVFIQLDNKLIVSYKQASDFKITRLLSNGNIDSSLNQITANEAVYKILLDNEGNLMFGGNFSEINGQGKNRFAKINYDAPSNAVRVDYENQYICSDSSMQIAYTAIGNFDASNVFTLELSDSTGSFASPMLLGTVNDTASGNITAQIPNLPKNSKGYYLRVNASNPAVTGLVSLYDYFSRYAPEIVNSSAQVFSCLEDSVLLTVSVDDAEQYQWYFNTTVQIGFTTDSFQFNSPASFADTGIYVLEINNACGVTYDSTRFNIFDFPLVNISNDTNACLGDTITLSISGAVNPMWLTNPVNDSVSVSPSVAQQVWVNYADTNGCNYSDTVLVGVFQLPMVTISNDTAICIGDTIQLTAGGGNAYTWSTAETNATISVSPNSTSTYAVEVVDSNMCKADDSVEVVVNLLPVLSLNLSVIDSTCENNPSFTMAGGLTPIGDSGIYSGNGVSNGIFNPATAGVGQHSISYEFTDSNTCYNSITATLTVLNKPLVSLAAFSQYCENDSTFVLSGGLPLGGLYFGNAVNAGMFNPPSGVTNPQVSYRYQDSLGCADTASQNITVFVKQTAIISTIPAVCDSSPSFSLMPFASPQGGYFVGAAVFNDTMFSPTIAIPGTDTLLYIYADNNACVDSAYQTILINPIPLLTAAALPDVCINAPGAQLSFATPSGGTYSGAGVNTNIFYPNNAGTGTHSIKYQFTSAAGCTDSIFSQITVNPLPVVSLTAFPSLCVDSTAYLFTEGSPIGGTYSGNQVSAGVFNASTAGVGLHLITYQFTDSNSCTNSTNQNILVNPLPNVGFSALAPVCIDATSFAISNGSPAGGIYTGNGVFNNNFYADTAGVGTHNLVYTYTNTNGCKNTANQTITVNALPIVSFSTVSSVCEDTSAFALSGGLPIGGTYTGAGVSAGNFYPNNVTPAASYTITYTYTDANNCTSIDTHAIQVDTLPLVNLNLNVTAICVSASVVTLSGGLPLGGTYVGNGITAGSFDPSLAGAATHLVEYIYTEPQTGCTSSDTQSVIVNPLPAINFPALNAVCVSEPSFPLQNIYTISPAGGVFSGQGVTAGGTFDASLAGVGTHALTYSFSDVNSCIDSVTRNITVNALPTVSLPILTPICVNANPFAFIGYSPLGGTFNGNGVIGNNFYPDSAGAGTHSINYTYTDINGCTDSTQQSILVYGLTPVNFAALDSVCRNDIAFTLTQGTPAGGVYSGNGVTFGTTYNPSIPLPGTYTLTYTYVDSNTCSNASQTTITVLALPQITFPNPPPFCVNYPAHTFQGVLPTGGYFSGPGTDSAGVFSPGMAGVGGHNVFYTYTDTLGCTNFFVQTTIVSPLPLISFDFSEKEICLSFSADIEAFGGNKYEWNTGDTTQKITKAPAEGTWFTVTVTDQFLCSSIDSAFLAVINNTQLEAYNDTLTTTYQTAIEFNPLTNDVGNLVDITIIKFPENGSIDTADSPILIYTPNDGFRRFDTLIYFTCDNRCPNVCDTAITRIQVYGDPYVFIPNGFSPNGDGINDDFVIPGIELYPDNEFMVFNRWGDVVYKAKPYRNTWSGEINTAVGLGAKKVPDGTYFYVIKLGTGNEPLQGYIEVKSR